MTTRIPGYVLTDHVVEVPLDHAAAHDGRTIEVFAREVVAVDQRARGPAVAAVPPGRAGRQVPAPGGRTTAGSGTRPRRTGCCCSTSAAPAAARRSPGCTVAGWSDADIAAYLRLIPRRQHRRATPSCCATRVAGGRRWETLGQSYGGFVTLTYLSLAPEGLDACYVTGGLPGLDRHAPTTSTRAPTRGWPRKNAEFYAPLPRRRRRWCAGSPTTWRRSDVRLPDGDRLTARRLPSLGIDVRDELRVRAAALAARGGLARRPSCPTSSCTRCMALTGHVDGPLFALQEYIYGQPGSGASGWAAERAMARAPGLRRGPRPAAVHRRDVLPLDVRGDPRAAAVPGRGRAAGGATTTGRRSTTSTGWPPTRCRWPRPSTSTTCTSTPGLQLDTAARVGNVRAWVTNEYEHDGLRADGPRVLGRLMDMRAGRL